MLVKQQIELLKEPSLQCADLVLNELQRMASRMDYKDLGRFHNLRERVVEVASKVLRKRLKPAHEMINNLIDCELACESHDNSIIQYLARRCTLSN
jgi:hypothetical protein